MRAGIPVLTMSELISTVRENLVRSYKILDESEQHRVRILTWSMVGQGKVREWWGIGVMETGGNAEGKRRLTFPPSLRVEKSSGSKGGSKQTNKASAQQKGHTGFTPSPPGCLRAMVWGKVRRRNWRKPVYTPYSPAPGRSCI